MLAAAALFLTVAQTQCLNMAYNYGEIYGLGKTFRAVVLVESSGCVNELGDDGRSVGPAQIQVYTAQQTCGCGVTAKALGTDDNYNLQLGAKFLSRCFNQFWPDRKRALYCYSAGIPQASKATASQVNNSKYVRKVERSLMQLKAIPVDTQ